MRGLGHTTLGRVAYFFKHQGNDLRGGENDELLRKGCGPCEWRRWKGQKSMKDPMIGCDIFILRKQLTFYLASAIRRIMYFVHSSPVSG